MVKRCSRCHAEKPLEDFYKASAKSKNSYGRRAYCKPCVLADNRERKAEAMLDPVRAARYRAGILRRNRAYARRLRDAVLTGYGGACACCGESTPQFLAVDHIHNDGAAHRAELSITRASPDTGKFYRWLRDNGYPRDRLQLLCHNCNGAKAWYGMCPHRRASRDTTPSLRVPA